MKKTILAAAMLVGALSAQAAFVASDDIYGIINIPISIGMNAVGVSLLPMSESANLVHDVILPAGLTAGDQSTGDGLWIYGATYDKYYLATGNVWTNGSAAPTATLGLGMWIKAAAATTIYQVGIMVNSVTSDVACASSGHSFISNPYPSDLVIDGVNSQIDWSEVAAWNKNSRTGDLLRIWTGTAYDTYYYFNNGTSGIDGWYSSDNKGRRPPAIPAGEGFFFQRRTEDSDPVTVSNPFLP